MANVVKDLLYKTAQRIGNPAMKFPETHGMILSTMNDVYKGLNRELMCVEKVLSLAAGTFSSTVNYYAVPADMIAPFNITPPGETIYELTFIPKERWNEEEYQSCDVFTIIDDKFVFGNVGADSAFDIYYYSNGFTLVDKDDDDLDTTVETNTPEWPSDLHRLLVYATALELNPAYKGVEYDFKQMESYKARLAMAKKNQQHITPMTMIPYGYWPVARTQIDPDYVDGQWVTRT